MHVRVHPTHWWACTRYPVIPLHHSPPPSRHRPQCLVKIVEGGSSIGKIGMGFPGSIMIGVANPLDEVLGVIAMAARVEDAFDFVFDVVINGDWERRRNW